MNKYEKYLDKKIEEYCQGHGINFIKTELIEGRHHFLPILLDRFNKIILLKQLEEQEEEKTIVRKQQLPIYSDEDIKFLIENFKLRDLTSLEDLLIRKHLTKQGINTNNGLNYRRVVRKAFYRFKDMTKKELNEVDEKLAQYSTYHDYTPRILNDIYEEIINKRKK